MAYQPIENYGLIGDMHSLALVSLEGSIDYMCMPRFDSPSIFAALLDDHKGGRFSLSPTLREQRVRQFYIPDTNILMTRFLSADGVAEIIDFMPASEEQHAHRVIRWVKTIRGRVGFDLRCAPRFDYGRADHGLTLGDGHAVFAARGGQGTTLRLQSSVPLRADGPDAVALFALESGETAEFILEVVPEDEASVAAQPGYVADAFSSTLAYWRRWTAQSSYRGCWTEWVNRSALAIKLLTSERYGSIAAAGTFGLPESVHGQRNWDYRYTWIRDASLTAARLIDIGYHREPYAFAQWVYQRYANADRPGELQIMYGIDGRKELVESVLDHLDGYMGSRPVRVGNGAWDQLQLDIYGELLLFLERYDAEVEPLYNDFWDDISRSVEWLCANWDREDEGVWEVRGGRRKFLYSRLMDWVGIDRAIRIAERRSLVAPIERWRGCGTRSTRRSTATSGTPAHGSSSSTGAAPPWMPPAC